MDVLKPLNAQEAEAVHQGANSGTREGIPIQHVCQQAEAVGTCEVPASDRETSEDLVPGE